MQFRMVTAGGENDSIAPDPADPDLIFGGRVEKLDLSTGADAHARSDAGVSRTSPLRLDAAARLLAARPARPLLRAPAALPHGGRAAGAGPRSARISPARTPGVPPNLDPATAAWDGGTGRAAGRHLRDRPVARGRSGHLGRHGRRPHLAQPRRGRPLVRRHAPGSRRVVEGHHARGFAHRSGHRLGGRRPASPRRLRALHLPHGGRRQELDAFGQRHSPRQLRQRRARGPGSPRPPLRRHREGHGTSRSTTATPGSPSSSICR